MSNPVEHKGAFFRQSGWLMIANLVAGVLMWGVHVVAGKTLSEADYGTMVKMFAVTILIPVIPLQSVFARETAAALALGQTPSLAGLIRRSMGVILALWLVALGVMLWFQQSILTDWKVEQPAALWLLAATVLGMMLLPLFFGALQGSQNFLWLGGSMMINGGARLLLVALLVFLATRTAASVMVGVAISTAVTLIMAMWYSRAVWTGPTAPFQWRTLLPQMLPALIGFTACQFIFSADTIYVGLFFSADETGYYAAAGTLSRALIWLVLPLATVMFPKLVHSSAKAEKSNLLGLTLVSTMGLAVVGALGLVVLGPFVVKLIYKPTYVEVVRDILPWYAAAMIPLSVANVLVNNLLAKSDLRAVPWLAAVAIGYAIALNAWHPSLKSVLQLLGGFTCLLFLVCVVFTWVFPKPTPIQQPR
jgi:O-antigen/teichoic acid export membrane protein